MPKGWPKLTEKKEEPKKETPEVLITERQEKKFVPTPKVEYQWLRMPHGMFNYEKPDLHFRAENAPSNKALIDSYRGLLDSGYEIKAFEIDAQFMYILFERRNG